MAAEARVLRIATIESLPFGYVDAAGNPGGLMFEIGNRVAEEAGLAYVNNVLPYARTVVELESGSYDVVLRYGNEQLSHVAFPVVGIVSFPSVVVGAAGQRFNSLADLRGKTVGVVRGGRFDDAFDADPAIRKEATGNYEQTMRMVVAKRIDAGIGSNVGLYFNAKRAGIRPDQLGPPLVLGHKTFTLFFSKKTADPEILNTLNAAAKRLQRTGELRRLIEKYVGDLPWESPADAQVSPARGER